MEHKTYTFSKQATQFYFDAGFNDLQEIVDKSRAIIITDKNIEKIYPEKFTGWKTITIEPGENNKQQFTVDRIIEQLVQLEADRYTTLIGVGGGVVTDITGYVASVYMRGIKFGFVPTSLLCIVDASIGGKNGIDVGVVKNMVGTISQPSFILHDQSFLSQLPEKEWINGFAEIIKHACIKDPVLFSLLKENEVASIVHSKEMLKAMIRNNVEIKISIVMRDEFEEGERKLLNFGHTIGHAVETIHDLPHGHAISIGMVHACRLSEKFAGLDPAISAQIISLLEKYYLPTSANLEIDKILELIRHDKKRIGDRINFILLNNIGDAVVTPLSFDEIKTVWS
ncbi:MAG: 3-dehydroquinate synthase [Chitinophagaceae bacterium]